MCETRARSLSKRGKRDREREMREREKAQLMISFYQSCGNTALNRFNYFCMCGKNYIFTKLLTNPKDSGLLKKTSEARAPEAAVVKRSVRCECLSAANANRAV